MRHFTNSLQILPEILTHFTPRLSTMSGLLIAVMRALEIIFLVGLAGSAIVVLISFVEDFEVLLHRDKPKARRREQTDAHQAHSGALPNLS